MPFPDLDAAWKADRFESLSERLSQMREDARDGGRDYQILMPNSKKPHNRLSSWSSWLKQYGRFLDGEPPGSNKDADPEIKDSEEDILAMGKFDGIEREHVFAAIREWVDTGRDEFLKKYGFGSSFSLVLLDDRIKKGGRYGSKAILGVSRKFAHPDLGPLPHSEFKGGKNETVKKLEELEFRVTDNFKPASKGSSQDESPESTQPTLPENLILYGPPGTGKTYHTADEAVRLCGESVHDDREALMQTYQRLLAMGRIEFVTFHQSMSYEDFVEGRQPMTGSEEDDDTSSGGFRLETVPGIFRRIARRAETSRGRSTDDNAISVADRHVFKMSIGEASNPEDAHLFEEAIDGGYTLLGYDDIDWSDDKYASREAIIKRLEAQGHTDLNAQSGAVQMPYIFRNWVKERDIVIVSKGNSLFRAIGEFTGKYEFHPRPEGRYSHRRNVRWHWVDRQGVPVSEIYTRNFMMKSIYALFESELNTPALERYLNSQQTNGPSEPEPFVLIIDEINRANISKVFGELITLLEPDKRLGQPNALKVRLPYSGDEFGVPSNLHILGTMNTADRSIALLDTALRRRFIFREMMPKSSLLDGAAKRSGIDLPRILDSLNVRIEYFYDREHQIGHAYFIDCESREDVDDVMRHKVIPLLAEYFFEDWGKIAAVLGDAASHDGEIQGGFLKRSVLKAPPGLEDGNDLPRFRWEVRSKDEGFDYKGLAEG